MKSKVALVLFVLLVLAGTALFVLNPAWAGPSRVVSFGADLNQSQRDAMLRVFGISPEAANMVTQVETTNAEERQYLKGVAPESIIGTHAISSVYVELLPTGRGITSETYNITWVTGTMYTSALATAGVKDARIIAAAPYPVSGTAALTGVFKAFETATGTKLSEQRKQAANEELVRTGELGQQIADKDKAAKLIVLVKQQVLQNKLSDPASIRSAVEDVAKQLNLTLTPDQINSIVDLMVKLAKTPITLEQFRTQLAGIQDKLNIILAKQEEARTFLEKIWAALQDFFSRIMAIFSGLNK